MRTRFWLVLYVYLLLYFYSKLYVYLNDPNPKQKPEMSHSTTVEKFRDDKMKFILEIFIANNKLRIITSQNQIITNLYHHTKPSSEILSKIQKNIEHIEQKKGDKNHNLLRRKSKCEFESEWEWWGRILIRGLGLVPVSFLVLNN